MSNGIIELYSNLRLKKKKKQHFRGPINSNILLKIEQ